MAKVYEGLLVDPGCRFAMVAARFNELITSRLVEGALDGLRRYGVNTDERVDLYWVPGCYEVPMVVEKAAASGRYGAVMALGAVIRGSTPHFEMVSGEVSKGVAMASQKTGVPCIFGVLTTDTIEQAIERAGTKMGNAGHHAATSALEMASLMSRWPA